MENIYKYDIPNGFKIKDIVSSVENNKLTIKIKLKLDGNFINGNIYKLKLNNDIEGICIFNKIVDNRIIGYICYYFYDNSIYKDSEFCINDMISEISTPSIDEIEKFNKLIKKKFSLEWDLNKNQLKYSPNIGDIVRINIIPYKNLNINEINKFPYYINESYYICIYPNIFIINQNGEQVDNIDTNEIGIKSIVEASNKDKWTLYKSLKNINKFWNPYFRQLEHFRQRSSINGIYFKLDKNGKIVKETDFHTEDNDYDYNTHNYFLSIEECNNYKISIFNFLNRNYD